MGRIEEYSQYVEEIIKQCAQYKPAYGDVEIQTVFDKANHHYQLLTVGWDGDERIRGCVMHLDLKGGKIWIQHDGTEDGIANELIAKGVPKQNMVLAFHEPFRRTFTDFAPN